MRLGSAKHNHRFQLDPSLTENGKVNERKKTYASCFQHGRHPFNNNGQGGWNFFLCLWPLPSSAALQITTRGTILLFPPLKRYRISSFLRMTLKAHLNLAPTLISSFIFYCTTSPSFYHNECVTLHTLCSPSQSDAFPSKSDNPLRSISMSSPSFKQSYHLNTLGVPPFEHF